MRRSTNDLDETRNTVCGRVIVCVQGRCGLQIVHASSLVFGLHGAEPFFRLHCESCPNLEHLLALSAAHQVLRDIAKVDNNRVPSQQENGALTTVAHLHIGQPCRKEKVFFGETFG